MAMIVLFSPATGKGPEDFPPKSVPPTSFARQHRQLDGRFSLWMGDDSCRDEQPKAQALNGHFGLPTQMALKQHGEIVGEHSQTERGFRCPEGCETERAQRKARL